MKKKVFIIGGEQIYTLFEDKYDEILLTYIDKSYKCDVFFPKINNKYTISNYTKPYSLHSY